MRSNGFAMTPRFRTPALAIVIAGVVASVGCGGRPTGKIEIRYMAWGNPEMLELEQHICDEFNAANPDIHASLLRVPQSAYLNKAIVMFASRTAPDVVRIDHYNFPSLVRKDYFYNLSTLARNDPSFRESDFEPAAVEEGRYKGDLYGMNVLFGANLIYYNKTMFEKVNLPDPWDQYQRGEWTYEAMRKAAIAMMKFDGSKPVKFGMAVPTWPSTVPMILAFGGRVLDPDFKTAHLDDPGTIAAYQFLYNLRWKDHCAPTPSQAANAAFPFESGKLGMEVNWMGQSVRYRKVIKNFDWDVVPMPKGPAGPQTILKGNQLVIFKETKHPEAAWRFVKFVTGEKIEKLLYVERRRSFPTRFSVNRSREYLESKQAPFHTQAFVDSIKNGHTLPINSRWGEWTTGFNSIVDGLFSGRTSDVKATLEQANRKVNEILADEEGY